MGTLPGVERPDEEGPTTLDRHEVAHVVISQFCTSAMEPPAVLMKSWAEVASVADSNPIGSAPGLSARRAARCLWRN